MKRDRPKGRGNGEKAASDALTDSEVLQNVREYVAVGRVAWAPHAQRRMADHGFDKDQAKQCLLRGQFYERPHTPNKLGPIQHVFTMRCMVDHRPVEVVATLKPELHVLVITVKPFRR